MPKIEKQSSTPVKQVKSGSLLSRSVAVNKSVHAGIHATIYGRTKTGKTRLLSTAPKPLYLISADIGGTKSISTVPGIEVVQVVLHDKGERGTIGVKDLRQYIRELADSDCVTVGLDTSSSLQEIILADILGLAEVPVQKSFSMATRDQYGIRSKAMKEILSDLLMLPKQNVFITAHEMNFNDSSEGGSDLLDPSIGPALSKSTATWMNGQVDYVCQTFIREKFKTTTQNGIPIKTKVGGVEYCLRVGPDPVFMTGFRTLPGAELPDVIVNPTFDKIMAVIEGRK